MMNSVVNALLTVLAGISSVQDVNPERLRAVSEDIVTVVEGEMKLGNLKSKIETDDAIAMLAGAVTNESAFNDAYETCRLTGDGGRSLGLGQVIHPWGWKRHSKEEICNNRKLQLALALYNIDECWSTTPDAAASFRCYTTGSAKRDSGAARREYRYYMKFRTEISEFRKLRLASDKFMRSFEKWSLDI
jgi:hypothetical protein